MNAADHVPSRVCASLPKAPDGFPADPMRPVRIGMRKKAGRAAGKYGTFIAMKTPGRS